MMKIPILPAIVPLLVIAVIVFVAVSAAKKSARKSNSTPPYFVPGPCCPRCGSPIAVGATFCAGCGAVVSVSAPTQEDRDKAEIASLSDEEVHRRYCDVSGRSDAYRYLCYEELERRKGNKP